MAIAKMIRPRLKNDVNPSDKSAAVGNGKRRGQHQQDSPSKVKKPKRKKNKVVPATRVEEQGVDENAF